jgi:hypothetical protein
LTSKHPIIITALALTWLAFACKTETREHTDGEKQTVEKPSQAPLPSDEAEFLAELIPLPGGAEAIEISYAVTGPALEGEMTILITEGGNKRERWELRTTGANTQLRSAGLGIVNAEQIWHAPEGQPGELRQNQLAALARTWSALPDAKRAAVVTAIRDWQTMLDGRRAEVPGDQGEILGVPCLQTRIAAQNLCMWEAVGLFLRYEGAAFTIEATQINRAPEVAKDAFELPPEAASATKIEAPTIDFAAALEHAAEGNFAELFLLVSQTRALPKLARPSEPPPPESETETGTD